MNPERRAVLQRVGRSAALAALIPSINALDSAVNHNAVAAEGVPAQAPSTQSAQLSAPGSRSMHYRTFGRTGLKVSEVGFGSWGIGGNGYGSVERSDALDALARAEALGCNFVDTAGVYGGAEDLLGEFLRGRRDKWIVATKYSGQNSDQHAGLEKTLEDQLRRLGTDAVDFYQLHWVPALDGKDAALWEQLYRVKKAGKARFIGVSLYTAEDIDLVLNKTQIDGFQVACSLLDPQPLQGQLEQIRAKRPGIIVRSALKEGFLAGKYKADATFPDPKDQRHKWTPKQIADTVAKVERFRFLEREAGSMATAAFRYPLSLPEVSTVIAGTKNVHQADTNFGSVSGKPLSAASLQQIARLQDELGLAGGSSWLQKIRKLIGV